MTSIKIGSKKLGVEFAFIAISYIFIYLMFKFVILSEECAEWWPYHTHTYWAFTILFGYNFTTYVMLFFSDPGVVSDLKYNET